MPASLAANSRTFACTTPSDTEIELTRLFDAPPDVFEAMTTPEHVVRWWGILDERYSVPICEIDDSKAGRDMVIGTGMEKGAATSYDRLEDLLHELQG